MINTRIFTKEYILGHVLGNEIVHKDQVTQTSNSNDRQNIGVHKREYFHSFFRKRKTLVFFGWLTFDCLAVLLIPFLKFSNICRGLRFDIIKIYSEWAHAFKEMFLSTHDHSQQPFQQM